MAPKSGVVAACAFGTAGFMATQTLFVQPAVSGQGAVALRGGRPAAPLSTAQRPAGNVPLSGIVGPSLVGAAAVGAALVSVSSHSSRTKVARKAEAVPRVFNPALEQGIGPAPIGFFDPLGFSKGKDEAEFRRLRTCEQKHGRLAMMASVGAVMQHYVHVPGFESVKGTFAAVANPDSQTGLLEVLAAAGFLELVFREKADSQWTGDFGDPLNVNMLSDEMYAKEINNGRMAMLSVLGIAFAEAVSGKDAIEQFGL
eukprot:TRINITY_DN74813_c0_g1_i1.p1 TRINITY_DN74813_c0_g1~~TRINITY_DN74813_c0_g1_i1.p1  ORF type:complete len:274 (-),score=60.33 TRINITY_DN74813_c0_g1_i1:358-1125(-)